MYTHTHTHTHTHTEEYYLAIKKHEIVPFAETQMDLDSIIQSEESQKEENKYCILKNICKIQKNGIDELICKSKIQTQMQKANLWIPGGKREVG